MELIHIALGVGAGPAPMTSNILSGISIALGGGVTLFVLNWVREHLTAKWKRKDEAGALAFSLVTQLDQLVEQCADVVDDPLYEDPQSGCWQSTVNTPTIAFGDHINWTVLPRMLQYRIRSIPNKISVADRTVENLFEYGDGAPDYSDAFSERSLQYASIGLECISLVDELVNVYKVPKLNRGEWNPKDRFTHTIKREREQREKPTQWLPIELEAAPCESDK